MALLEIFDLQHLADETATSLHAAASADLRSPARWPQTRGCCCSTSRQPA